MISFSKLKSEKYGCFKHYKAEIRSFGSFFSVYLSKSYILGGRFFMATKLKFISPSLFLFRISLKFSPLKGCFPLYNVNSNKINYDENIHYHPDAIYITGSCIKLLALIIIQYFWCHIPWRTTAFKKYFFV